MRLIRGRLDYVELGFKRNSVDRTTWRSDGICGACCPICCPRGTASFPRRCQRDHGGAQGVPGCSFSIQLHRGGFILAAVTKVGAPNGTSGADRYDRWFRYPAGFSASTLTKTFDSVGGEGTSDRLFIDPFCGAGTVGTAALARGHRFAGIDAHPLIVELARAKLSPPDRPTEELVEVATAISKTSKASIDQETELVRRCFDAETLGFLCGMRAQINRQSRWKTHLTWALLGTLRDVSDKKVGWPYQRPGQSRRPVAKDARARFLKRAEAIAEDISEQPLSGTGTVRLGDSRSAKPWRELLDGDKADACITSPPYLNNFDYADATRLEVYFLGRASSWYSSASGFERR